MFRIGRFISTSEERVDEYSRTQRPSEVDKKRVSTPPPWRGNSLWLQGLPCGLIPFIFVLFCLILLLPILVLVSILIKITSVGPIFFTSQRVGKNGKVFTFYKFRTMKKDAEKNGPQLVRGDDPSITKLGKFLRFTYLDELPQLFNILKGEMNFVGPRPEVPYFHRQFSSEVKNWQNRLAVKPGITGWAQIHRATSFEPEKKLFYDLEYICKKSIWFDSKIILLTFWFVVKKF
ncbi:MAG: glycosyl transferase [Candidatus Berkelbacteria bacterium Licking1014_7]|uniref:Glycosyl transferase n=1 Tax=Candidatus Berkelbacteria bacterium Licking1014_7 TaxID=2017147 RepID=A0A554LJP0_9BACT|nr:MAG: glycosyl transferase [Candidatus Berkelbacteria bacterium Licking1014_7]